MGKAKKTLVVVLVSAVVVLLAAIAMIVVPIFTHAPAGSSGQELSNEIVSEITAKGDDGRQRTLTVTQPDGKEADLSSISPGEVFRVSGSGFDASVGIYVGVCELPDAPDVKPEPCLGGIPENAEEEKTVADDEALESAWVTNHWAWRAFASHRYLDATEGTFEVLIRVPEPTVEGLDCRVEQCAIVTRADHTAMQDRVQDLFLPVQFAQ